MASLCLGKQPINFAMRPMRVVEACFRTGCQFASAHARLPQTSIARDGSADGWEKFDQREMRAKERQANQLEFGATSLSF
jgi:hypothetical protein